MPTWLADLHTLHAPPFRLRYNNICHLMLTPPAEPLLTDLETLTSSIDNTIAIR